MAVQPFLSVLTEDGVSGDEWGTDD